MKIGLVSEKTGLGIHTIRYYEKQGLITKPGKDQSGHKVYDAKDVELLNWISCMKNSGMPLSQIQEYSKAFYEDNRLKCLQLLEEHMSHLNEQRIQLDHYLDVTEKKIDRLKKSLT